MEHFNPILGSEPNGQKFITCGEIMLRLTPPNYEKIRMASAFRGQLRRQRGQHRPRTGKPRRGQHLLQRSTQQQSLGKSAVRWLRSNDALHPITILTEPDETPSNRLGTYYLEIGTASAHPRSSMTAKHSAITEYDFSQVDLDALLESYDWLHLSGITPALAPNCRSLILDMLKVAKKKGPDREL